MPIPPPTSSGRSTLRRKPFPSGPRMWSSSPGSSAHNARVPGPIASIKNASSLGGARQRLIGRGSSRPGASSMKNCPGTPGSSPPRPTRSSVYGPTFSFARTLSRSRLTFDPLLEGEGLLGARVRDRVHSGGGAGALGGVDDEVAAAASDQVDDGQLTPILAHLPYAFHLEPELGERAGGPGGGHQLEAEIR